MNKFESQQQPSTNKNDDRIDKDDHRRKHKKERKKKSKKSRTRSPDSTDGRHSKKVARDKRETESSGDASRYQPKESSNQQESDLFKIDRRRDKDNLMYDGLYAGDVPKYRVKQSKEPKSKSKAGRYFNVKLLNKVDDCNRKNSNKSTAICPDIGEDFIRLSDSSELATGQPNRPLYEPAAETEISTNEISYEHQELHDRTRQFNSYLNKNTHDVDRWIEFIEFQDELMFVRSDSREARKSKSEPNDVYLAEKKLMVLEKALKANPANVRLMILKLELLKSTKEPAELAKEWENLAFVHPNNFEITTNHLKFIATHISYFNVANLNRFFGRYMEKIVQYQEGHLRSIRNESIDVVNLERSMLELLLLYTTILRQCGFIERAISIWQALIEFNWNKPDFLTNRESLDDWKEYFEIFWSSGEQRFGEKGAAGWRRVLEKCKEDGRESKANQSDEEEKLKWLSGKENEIVRTNQDQNKIWFEIELLREKHNWLSAKPHEECDDVEHTVLFEDIAACLFRFRDERSFPNSLVYFLCFLEAIQTDCLPNFCLDNEETLLKSANSGQFTPKYFTYEQRVKFVIAVFQQSMALVQADTNRGDQSNRDDQGDRRNRSHQSDYHRLVGHYLQFVVRHVQRLGLEQARKLFKQTLKKPSNCSQIDFWKQFVQLEVRSNERTSAKRIYRQMLVMLINQQQPASSEQRASSQQADQQFVSGGPADEISDFIEFELQINGVKPESLLVCDSLKPGEFEKEKEMGEEILIFAYSILNSRAFDAVREIGPALQLRTIRRIEQLLADCFEQVAAADGHSRLETDCRPANGGSRNTKDDAHEDAKQLNNLISLIVLKSYDRFFRRLLAGQPAERPAEALARASGVFDEAASKIELALPDRPAVHQLIERIHEKQLDLHLLFLKFNFGNLRSFNQLLRRAIERYPKNRHLLTLLSTQNSFRCLNGQIEQ